MIIRQANGFLSVSRSGAWWFVEMSEAPGNPREDLRREADNEAKLTLCGTSLCLDPCVQKLIQYLSVLDHTAAQPALQHVPGLLQHPARIGIAGIRLGIDSYQMKAFKGVFGKLRDRLRHQSFTPIRLTQPVAHFSRQTMNVLIERDSYASNGFFLSCNRKKRCWILTTDHFQKRRSAGLCVRMRKCITQVEPDLAIVRISPRRPDRGYSRNGFLQTKSE